MSSTLLHKLRLASGMSLKELSEKSGLSEAALSRIERGERSPKAASLVKIARALDLDKLFTLVEPWVEDEK